MGGVVIYTQAQQLAVKEYQGQRVITFRDVDTLHQRPEGTARRNFNANRGRFIKGEDYFTVELTADEIRTQFGAGKNAGRSMIVLPLLDRQIPLTALEGKTRTHCGYLCPVTWS